MDSHNGESKPPTTAATAVVGSRRDAVVRSYSTSFYGSAEHPNYEMKMKNLRSKSRAVNRSWSFGHPEMQRKRRVAGYKVYAVEGKMKGSIKKGFRWIKDLIGIS